MKAKCKKCGDTVEVTKLREYKTCKCGAIGLDYGDGYYYRVCGSPEDFDGEIEGAPDNLGITKVEDPHKPEKIDVILNGCSTEELKKQAGRQALNGFREKEYRKTKERLKKLMHDNQHKPEKLGVISNGCSIEELNNLMHNNHRDLSHEGAPEKSNIADALELCVVDLRKINSSVSPQREISIAITKIEEAIMWLRKGE